MPVDHRSIVADPMPVTEPHPAAVVVHPGQHNVGTVHAAVRREPDADIASCVDGKPEGYIVMVW